MPKYRKLPVVIEANRWFKNGDHPLDYSKPHDGLENGELRVFSPEERRANKWEGDIVRYFRHPVYSGERMCEQCPRLMHDHGWIDTLEGGHIVCPGDWIITGVKGEKYPCKDEIFKATYEPVEVDDVMEPQSPPTDAPVHRIEGLSLYSGISRVSSNAEFTGVVTINQPVQSWMKISPEGQILEFDEPLMREYAAHGDSHARVAAAILDNFRTATVANKDS